MSLDIRDSDEHTVITTRGTFLGWAIPVIAHTEHPPIIRSLYEKAYERYGAQELSLAVSV